MFEPYNLQGIQIKSFCFKISWAKRGNALQLQLVYDMQVKTFLNLVLRMSYNINLIWQKSQTNDN